MGRNMISLLALLCVMAFRMNECVEIGDECTEHEECNNRGIKGTAPVDHTRCDSGKCQCISIYYGEEGDTICKQATLGDTCHSKQDNDTFCKTADVNGQCSNDTKVCVCEAGYFQEDNVYGIPVCLKIAIGTPCDAITPAGTTFCQTGIPTAVCSDVKRACTCPEGTTYVESAADCVTAVYTAECKKCRDTGGECYDLYNNGTTSGCECPENKASSGKDLSGSIALGCDLGQARLYDYCDLSGPVSCVTPNADCLHSGLLTQRYACRCKPGYTAVATKRDPSVFECHRMLSPVTDKNCETCVENDGQCYDIDGDKVRDGCQCPFTRSTSNIHDPSKDCETNHVKVNCSANTMTVCYLPHNTTKMSNMGPRMDTGESQIFVRDHLGQDPCMFENPGGEWCLDLSLKTGESEVCGVKTSYPTKSDITYQNWVILQRDPKGRTVNDVNFHVYCKYDTQVHTFTSTGTEVVGFVEFASEGKSIRPELILNVYDEFGRDASIAGIQIGQPAQLVIKVTDNKGVYNSIRAEVCIAASHPELLNPSTKSILLIYDGCPVDEGYILKRDNFFPDPTDAETLRTGLFQMFQFEESEFIFFHCAVRVCRDENNCFQKTCVSQRRRRSAEIAETSLTRTARAAARETPLESLKSKPISVFSRDRAAENSLGDPLPSSCKGLMCLGPNSILVIVGVISSVLVLTLMLGVSIYLYRRRSRASVDAVDPRMMAGNNMYGQ